MCCNHFQNTLHYTSPAHGDWGLVRVAMMLPESHQLFVCPAACGRHGALGAYQQNQKERLSYLYVDQSDIVDGYDDLIIQACGELLEALDTKPKVLLIVVSCIDDFLGTDHEAVAEKLHSLHPAVRFIFGHMNPISLDKKHPPMISTLHAVYGLLEKNDTELSAVNLIGCFAGIEKSCELYRFLKTLGIEYVRHIGECKTFEDFKRMEQSRLNLLFSPAGKFACEGMEKKAGIPYIPVFIGYDKEEIKKQYARIAAFFGTQTGTESTAYDFSADIEQAEKAVQRAKEKIGSLPVIIDDSCTRRPFSLGRVLLNYGFNVVRIFAQQCIPPDKAAYDEIVSAHPEVEIVQPQHHDILKFDKRLPESLALGFQSGYISASDYVVNLVNDDGLFGFDGVRRLADMMSDALNQKADLERMIKEYGLVI